MFLRYLQVGYAFCVQYNPGSNGDELVREGTSGLCYSNDEANNWKLFSTVGSLCTILFMNPLTAIVAGRINCYV